MLGDNSRILLQIFMTMNWGDSSWRVVLIRQLLSETAIQRWLLDLDRTHIVIGHIQDLGRLNCGIFEEKRLGGFVIGWLVAGWSRKTVKSFRNLNVFNLGLLMMTFLLSLPRSIPWYLWARLGQDLRILKHCVVILWHTTAQDSSLLSQQVLLNFLLRLYLLLQGCE